MAELRPKRQPGSASGRAHRFLAAGLRRQLGDSSVFIHSPELLQNLSSTNRMAKLLMI